MESHSNADAKPIHITITEFDTIEYCNSTAARARGAAAAGVVAGVTKGTVFIPVVPSGDDGGGDYFAVRIVGTINGKPFDVARAFNYSDIHFFSFPSENSEYRGRIHDALEAAVQGILATEAE